MEIRNETGHRWNQHRWAVSDGADPQDLILAVISGPSGGFNRNISLSLPRDKPAIISEVEELTIQSRT